MESIEKHIEKDREILENPTISPQQRRHIEGELHDLEAYAEHHKEVSDRLTKLEMWKWYVIGMATLAGFIFSLLPDFIT